MGGFALFDLEGDLCVSARSGHVDDHPVVQQPIPDGVDAFVLNTCDRAPNARPAGARIGLYCSEDLLSNLLIAELGPLLNREALALGPTQMQTGAVVVTRPAGLLEEHLGTAMSEALYVDECVSTALPGTRYLATLVLVVNEREVEPSTGTYPDIGQKLGKRPHMLECAGLLHARGGDGSDQH